MTNVLIKHPKTRPCAACTKPTTLTLEALTRKDEVVSFPCCMGCRTQVSLALEIQGDEMAKEAKIDKIIAKMRLDDTLIDQLAGEYRDMAESEDWKFVPSIKSKVLMDRAAAKMPTTPSILQEKVDELKAIAKAEPTLAEMLLAMQKGA